MPKPDLKGRRKADAVCRACKSPGFVRVADAPDGRPSFTCSTCGHYWTWGKDGGVYAEAIQKEAEDA